MQIVTLLHKHNLFDSVYICNVHRDTKVMKQFFYPSIPILWKRNMLCMI